MNWEGLRDIGREETGKQLGMNWELLGLTWEGTGSYWDRIGSEWELLGVSGSSGSY